MDKKVRRFFLRFATVMQITFMYQPPDIVSDHVLKILSLRSQKQSLKKKNGNFFKHKQLGNNTFWSGTKKSKRSVT